MTHISFSSLFRKNNMGGKTDWVGKKLTSQIFPRGKKLTGPAHSFPGEKTDRSVLSPGKKLTGEKTDRYTYTGMFVCYNHLDFKQLRTENS